MKLIVLEGPNLGSKKLNIFLKSKSLDFFIFFGKSSIALKLLGSALFLLIYNIFILIEVNLTSFSCKLSGIIFLAVRGSYPS